jgi:hypothetical protein
MADVNEDVAGNEEEVELDEMGNPIVDEDAEGSDADGAGDEAGDDAGEEKDSDEAGGEDASDSDADGDDDAANGDSASSERDEVSSLRQMSRALRLEVKALQTKLQKQTDALVDKDIITEDEVDSADDRAAFDARQSTLNDMLELMELNPKFEDVKEVCSQVHFDDTIEMLANAYVAENGGDVDDTVEALTGSVWSKTNPFKEMYGLIKKYHPNYTAEGAEKNDTGAKPPGKKKNKVAPSLSDMPAGAGKNSTGWTSERIDKLSEDKLDNVPADVYEKYMRGELD